MNLRLSMPTDGVTEPGSPRRVAYEMTEEAFGPGRNSPMIAVVDATSTPEDQRMQNFGAAVEKLQGTDGVSNAQIIALNDAQDTAQVLITPERPAARPAQQRRQLQDHRCRPHVRGHLPAA